MKDDNCIFCKLANGDIPTNSIYEDDDFKVILDASPATKGHALILPKQHYANIFEEEELTKDSLLSAVKEVYCNRDKYKDAMAKSGQMDSIATIIDLINSQVKKSS